MIIAVQTRVPVKKNTEFLADYGYPMTGAPRWYRLLYKDFAKKFPEKANDQFLSQIGELEKSLQKHSIPLRPLNIARHGYNNI